MQIEPELQAAWHNRGVVYLRHTLLPVRPRVSSSGETVAPPTHQELFARALADFSRAIALGPPSGDLCYDAAFACAKHHPVLKEQAIDYLGRGLEYGLDRQKLRQQPFASVLKDDPAYKELLARPPQPHGPVVAEHVLPIPPE